MEITVERIPEKAPSIRALAYSINASFEGRWILAKRNRGVDNITAFLLSALRARGHVLHAVLQDCSKGDKAKYNPNGYCTKLAKKPVGKVLVLLYALSRRSQGFGENFPLARGSPNLPQCLNWVQRILYSGSRSWMAPKGDALLVRKKNAEFLGLLKKFGY